MAVLFDNTSGQNFTSSLSWVVTKPTHVHDGDLIIVTIVVDGTAGAPTVPSGFTQIGAAQAASSDCELRVYWKVAASEPSSWTWTWPGNELGQVEVTTYTGQHATPIGSTVNVDYRHGSVTGPIVNVTTSAITPPVNDCMIVATYGVDPAGAFSITAVSPATERVDRANGIITWLGLIEWLQTTAASVTLGVTPSDTSDIYAWNMFAIRPAAAPAGPTFVPQIVIM